MSAFAAFLRKNPVFTVAAVLALFSSFWVPPSAMYLHYINWQVLAVLFCLMLVVGGWRESGIFAYALTKLLPRLSSTRSLAALLVLACFFTSMWITNDVSLLTFVPFSLVALRGRLSQRQISVVIVLQTLAANLGSMCLPVGNPQNLYLYFRSGMDMLAFVRLLLPYSLLSFLLLLSSLRLIPKRSLHPEERKKGKPGLTVKPAALWLLAALFALSLLTVLHLLDYRLSLGLTVLAIGLWRPRYFRYVDGTLLLTFVAFFILVGNLGQLPFFRQLLQGYLAGHEFWLALLTSQVISNVPAAMLLSGFTTDYEALLLGTDIGGLGTLIASMASLISYGIYTRAYPRRQGYFLVVFTLLNLVFLGILLLAYAVIR